MEFGAIMAEVWTLQYITTVTMDSGEMVPIQPEEVICTASGAWNPNSPTLCRFQVIQIKTHYILLLI